MSTITVITHYTFNSTNITPRIIDSEQELRVFYKLSDEEVDSLHAQGKLETESGMFSVH